MNAPVFETLLFEVRGHVALVSLNRPERLNAMNRTMLRELNEACDLIEADDSIFVAVLTGEGKSFSSGFDLKEQAENTPVGFSEWRRALRQDFDAVMRFWNLSKPTVAAVCGHALAGGCELALACDITVAAEMPCSASRSSSSAQESSSCCCPGSRTPNWRKRYS